MPGHDTPSVVRNCIPIERRCVIPAHYLVPSLKQQSLPPRNLSRREFLGWCGALSTASMGTLSAKTVSPLDSLMARSLAPALSPPGEVFYQPKYIARSPLDRVLEKVDPRKDVFPTESVALAIERVLERWSRALVEGTGALRVIRECLSPSFTGSPLEARERIVSRSDENLQITERNYPRDNHLAVADFLPQLDEYIRRSRYLSAEFRITRVSPSTRGVVSTHIRYDLTDTGAGYYRRQRSGWWQLEWDLGSPRDPKVTRWQLLNETCSRALRPVFQEVTTAVLGGNESYHQQLVPGTDYWRTLLDGASGIDIYGNYGVVVGDIDNDGFDDLYVCQPSGLPNRLYRNRGDGTFEDVTEQAGVGVLDSSPSALFADVNNDGRQDLIVVRGAGPLLFINQGGGRFRLKPGAFQFARSPQGTFTGTAMADYDRDGWLDIYFCLYSYYRGPDRYRYPVPYYDARNGPPNFLFRNNRDETFADVTQSSGLNENNDRFSFACGWNDYDLDGWPDLYVANDFGQKNLYHNKGDGTFTDAAWEAGVLDTGAGMSVCWLDFDNDGRQDLYVADMWTAAGLRVTGVDDFMPGAPEAVRIFYQKHAMGNSLFRNEGNGKFADVSSTAGVRFGRWAWSSDAWDFDHDGYPDLYVANGMISGPNRLELSSFFWRQVVAQSPPGSVPTQEYEQGWNAINELIRCDGTWSGYERNVFYANNRDGTFSDVSGAVGLDFLDDSRSFSLTDIDHDGRLEVILKNRTGPQVRVLRNVAPNLGASIAFRLRGVKSNRDAIGASIAIENQGRRQVKYVQAGSGFLAQHTKDLFFGLGESTQTVRVTVRWPSGLLQQFENVPARHLVEIEEGSQEFRAARFLASSGLRRVESTAKPFVAANSSSIGTWLLEPLDAPAFSLPDLAGRIHALRADPGENLVLSLWSLHSTRCASELRMLQRFASRWRSAGIQLLAVNLDDPSKGPDIRGMVARLALTFPILLATPETGAVYNLLYRYLFDRRRDLPLPVSFLIDRAGMIVKVYSGPLNPGAVLADVQHIPLTAREREARALPFPGRFYGGFFTRNYFTYGVTFARHGYPAAAENAFLRAIREEPQSADAYYDLGTLYMREEKWELASEQLHKAVELKPDDLMGLNNLGVIAARLGRGGEAESYFESVLQTDPRNVVVLENLADLYQNHRRYPQAEALLKRALAIEPRDADLNYRLGMVFAHAGESEQAKRYLAEAIRLRPDYPEALNNLGVLFVMMGESSLAVRQFQTCIARAPKFDQAYLNLARIDIKLDRINDARMVLLALLREVPEHPLAKKFLQELDR
jgi:Flp pilus assembly protein TadD/peroxiredoxin